jgi:glycosyltransferase involved in cell wall biosynthesis
VHVGLLSTSWPSSGRPWAGHFIRDLAIEIVDAEIRVTVVTPQWSGHGPLEREAALKYAAPVLAGAPGSLANDRLAGARAFWVLRGAARRLEVDLWLCHWWPTRFTLPSTVACLVVLHGSDVDLLARLPGPVRRWVGRRLCCVAVANGVAQRFSDLTGQSIPPVFPLGARGPSAFELKFPDEIQAWAQSEAPRVLTVARNEPGKGWRTVKAAQSLLPEVDWLGLKPEDGIGPDGVRALIARADLVVVPSEEGAGLPSEGSPHVIAQAMVAGVPVVGGPNAAVREALELHGQVSVALPGHERLASEVRRALEPEVRIVLADRARQAGRLLGWSVVAPKWRALLRGFGTQRGHQTTLETPSC